MHIEILLEEQSAAAALNKLLPKILGEVGKPHTWKLYPHRNKQDLLKKLLPKFRAYQKWVTENYAIVVLCDQDDDDCHELKKKIVEWAGQAGLRQFLVRIIVTELESWFLGDAKALEATFPKLSQRRIGTRTIYRNPDTRKYAWEDLDREMQKAGYSGYRKVQHAAEIAAYMIPQANKSHSFKVFCKGLKSLTNR